MCSVCESSEKRKVTMPVASRGGVGGRVGRGEGHIVTRMHVPVNSRYEHSKRLSWVGEGFSWGGLCFHG